jgi:hypothetical protein
MRKLDAVLDKWLAWKRRTRLRYAGPTDAPAGSVRKLAVLCLRQGLGVPLWHPLDSIRLDHSAAQSTTVTT